MIRNSRHNAICLRQIALLVYVVVACGCSSNKLNKPIYGRSINTPPVVIQNRFEVDVLLTALSNHVDTQNAIYTSGGAYIWPTVATSERYYICWLTTGGRFGSGVVGVLDADRNVLITKEMIVIRDADLRQLNDDHWGLVLYQEVGGTGRFGTRVQILLLPELTTIIQGEHFFSSSGS